MDERVRQWYLSKARISYRRLQCLRDKKFKEQTNSFVDKVMGSKYGFSFKSMVLNLKDIQPEDKSKFFCSELVTAFYKHLGLLKKNVKSHTYMPGDFAARGSGARLNLVDAILEHEVKVTRLSKWSKTKFMRSSEQQTQSSSSFACLVPKRQSKRSKGSNRRRSRSTEFSSFSTKRVQYSGEENTSYFSDDIEITNSAIFNL